MVPNILIILHPKGYILSNITPFFAISEKVNISSERRRHYIRVDGNTAVGNLIGYL